jgi:hypothetical protein
MQVLLITES